MCKEGDNVWPNPSNWYTPRKLGKNLSAYNNFYFSLSHQITKEFFPLPGAKTNSFNKEWEGRKKTRWEVITRQLLEINFPERRKDLSSEI